MPNFLKHHSDFFLGFLALLFLGLIVWYVGWGVQAFTAEAEKAFSLQGAGAGDISFDIQGAAKLDLRGLTQP